MTHRVPAYYCSVSEQLSNILDNVGFSHEERDRKVRLAIEAEVFWNIQFRVPRNMRVYIFGSRGEGSTGPGLQSDEDILYQSIRDTVVTDLSQCQPEMNNLLMVKENHTHPGYVKVQYIAISQDYTPVPVYLEKSNNDSIAIDLLNRALMPNTVIHRYGLVSGPAVHNQGDFKEFSIDSVLSLRCSQWPQEGYEWFQRPRLYGWPAPIQIENARDYGCFVTPVGHPHSFEHQLEWRLSFSIVERELTRSFDDTTMKVYILLKIIRKSYIEPVVGGAFSSYHCKVCMLWTKERTPRELWSSKNLLYCLILCIRQLYEWATTGFCPDYFIVTNNIFDRKIIRSVRAGLVKILGHLLSTDCTFLLEIKCCNLGQHITNAVSIFDHCRNSNTNEEIEEIATSKLTIRAVDSCRRQILQHIPQHYPTMVDYLSRIRLASNYLPYNLQYAVKHAMMLLWSQLGFLIATICRDNACFLSHEKVDYLVDLASGCLSFGINSDATSVRLKLCGLGMELGNYDLIEISLQDISDYRMRYMYSVSYDVCDRFMAILNCNVDYCRECCRKRCDTEELLQTQTSFGVTYLPAEISITPKPLRIEMFRSIGAPTHLRNEEFDFWFEWGVVDSLMCLYFYQYLNFSRQGKMKHKQVAMDNMINVIRNEPKILNRDTAFNLLGYSFMQENQLTNAFRCFMQSLKIRPHHNAAKFYLGILFKRICATHRRRPWY